MGIDLNTHIRLRQQGHGRRVGRRVDNLHTLGRRHHRRSYRRHATRGAVTAGGAIAALGGRRGGELPLQRLDLRRLRVDLRLVPLGCAKIFNNGSSRSPFQLLDPLVHRSHAAGVFLQDELLVLGALLLNLCVVFPLQGGFLRFGALLVLRLKRSSQFLEVLVGALLQGLALLVQALILRGIRDQRFQLLEAALQLLDLPPPLLQRL
mmetsp:Transcript_130177/g.417770  ORF Transcript_130177/g.417770 Transcript_130177/m.417770 type:complete len:207 (+) Transcript_130177:1099-1719(+)